MADRYSETFTNVTIRNLDACMATGIQPDGLWIYGDMAFNHATMCSPAMYKELYLAVPQTPGRLGACPWNGVYLSHRRRCERRHGPLRRAGFDALQPLECKANMDVRNLLPKYAKSWRFSGTSTS